MFSKKIKSFVKDYFTLTSRERKGAMALSLLIMIQAGIMIWLNFIKTPKEPALSRHAVKISGFVRKVEEKKIAQAKYQRENSSGIKTTTPVRLFDFDPNHTSDEQWMELGLSRKQTAVIRNYLNKGGVFRKKEDLAKIFSITQNQYGLLEPFIKIPEKITGKNNNEWVKSKSEVHFQKVNINTADTVELCRLPLVGPGRARLIFRYREALGGFVNAQQLLEVYSMDSSVFAAILPKIFVDKSLVRKVNLNADEIRHPYLNKQLVYTIKAYRKQHGNFTDVNDLKQLAAMSDEILVKLAPYAAFE